MQKLSMKLIFLTGFLLLTGGLFYDILYAGIPYQDPTAAQQAAWSFHSKIAETIQLFGLVTIITGVIVGVLKIILRSK